MLKKLREALLYDKIFRFGDGHKRLRGLSSITEEFTRKINSKKYVLFATISRAFSGSKQSHVCSQLAVRLHSKGRPTQYRKYSQKDLLISERVFCNNFLYACLLGFCQYQKILMQNQKDKKQNWDETLWFSSSESSLNDFPCLSLAYLTPAHWSSFQSENMSW